MLARLSWLLFATIAVLLVACSGDDESVPPSPTNIETGTAPADLSVDQKLDFALGVFATRYADSAGTAAAGPDHAFLYLSCAASPSDLRAQHCNDGPYGESSWAGSFVVEAIYQRALDFDGRGRASTGSQTLEALEAAYGAVLPPCSARMLVCDGDLVTIQEGVVYFGTRFQEYLVVAIGRVIDEAIATEDQGSAVVLRLQALRTEHQALLERMLPASAALREGDEVSLLSAAFGPPLITNAAERLREDLIRDALRGRFSAQKADAIYARSLQGDDAGITP